MSKGRRICGARPPFMNFCMFVQLISSLDFMRNVCIFIQLVFHYSHGPSFFLYISRALLNPIYSSVLGKHEDKHTLWRITIYRTYHVTNCVTLVLKSLLSDKTAFVNSCIFHSSFIEWGKNDRKCYSRGWIPSSK